MLIDPIFLRSNFIPRRGRWDYVFNHTADSSQLPSGGGVQERSIEELISDLGESNRAVVDAAKVNLIAKGLDAINQLFDISINGGWLQRSESHDVLKALGLKAVPYLKALLKDTNKDKRKKAVELLAGSKEVAGATKSELMEALNDTDEKIREIAVSALGGLREEAQGAVPTLERMLKFDTNKDVRQSSLIALVRILPQSEYATRGLYTYASRLKIQILSIHREYFFN